MTLAEHRYLRFIKATAALLGEIRDCPTQSKVDEVIEELQIFLLSEEDSIARYVLSDTQSTNAYANYVILEPVPPSS